MGWLLEMIFELVWLDFVDRVTRGRSKWLWLLLAFTPLLGLVILIVLMWQWLG